ncbi:malolactic enzyme [Ligilactobacillus aviarius]|uniref:Malolactic enzyme n=1 Tax=Ligilactobacillus aviarius TaxID=1606 RepID=A0A179C825_9LACO|nr:malolactic enzyme [Ligilactobacillus aviarius]OAP98845.1 NAD-dependent malic enzyme [Ligilactobacillus aviarius]OAP99511.1 NAD-dependent malic enzyme [Ligilactobacillus aviarius]OAQ01238.1 NAD-dependent malic enzyme [Ligilactobacillus aviarius]OAQ02831.1 NAD-dependent malic enzyme [Ligilactobacillus aviarius]OAQ05404.1 NAD-dependent malic enzyme [Ligilactobacillus aviarius]
MKRGIDVLRDPFLNKGTAFTNEERKEYGLVGMLPIGVQSIEEQAKQTYEHYQSKPNNFEKRKFLMEIFNTNRTLFYYLMSKHLVEFMPIVYDPVIADSIENYSHVFVQPQDAAFISIDAQDDIEDTLKNAAEGRDIKLIVVSDAEAILGIGDWGTQGVDISVGKLMVYTAASGIDPRNVLPVSLDAGTDNEELLNDPLYLGNHHKRIYGDKYYEMVDKFVESARKLFPDVLIHFEDFGRSNADVILQKYQNEIPVFNDDIQGTGIICLAGVLGALNISKEKLEDQIFLTFGAGTAGCGIAQMMCDELVRNGMSEEEAKKHFYLVDKQGLLFEDTEGLTPAQKPFVRQRSEFDNADELTNLEAIVKAVHPTVMIGTSKQPGAFTESIVKEMAAHTERPIIFPISNPTKLLEAKAEDLIKWTDGRALVATGIPSDPVEYNGVTYTIGQANNALVYPGVGFGSIAAKAKVVNEKMLAAAAHALGGIVDASQPGAPVLPPVAKLTEFTQTVAETVAQSAIDQGIAGVSDAHKAVADMKWEPKY